MNLSIKQCEELKIPYNPYTGNQYTNNNLVLLAAYTAEHYTSPQWAGYQQWLKLGRVVRKGESGTRILMVKSKKLVDKLGVEQIKQYPSSVTVFNFEQTMSLEEAQPREEEKGENPA